MDVANCRRREIVINDKIDTFEVNTTAHQFRSNKYPYLRKTQLFQIEKIMTKLAEVLKAMM